VPSTQSGPLDLIELGTFYVYSLCWSLHEIDGHLAFSVLFVRSCSSSLRPSNLKPESSPHSPKRCIGH
jgi:hypothetical protein